MQEHEERLKWRETMEGMDGEGVQEGLASAGGASTRCPRPISVAPTTVKPDAGTAGAAETMTDDWWGGSTASRRPTHPLRDSAQVSPSAIPVAIPATRPWTAGSVNGTISAPTDHGRCRDHDAFRCFATGGGSRKKMPWGLCACWSLTSSRSAVVAIAVAATAVVSGGTSEL